LSTKQAQLDQIATEIVKNNVCPDLAKTAKHLVPGSGSPDAKIIFIGESSKLYRVSTPSATNLVWH